MRRWFSLSCHLGLQFRKRQHLGSRPTSLSYPALNVNERLGDVNRIRNPLLRSTPGKVPSRRTHGVRLLPLLEAVSYQTTVREARSGDP